jgi:hypothetical protein
MYGVATIVIIGDGCHVDVARDSKEDTGLVRFRGGWVDSEDDLGGWVVVGHLVAAARRSRI